MPKFLLFRVKYQTNTKLMFLDPTRQEICLKLIIAGGLDVNREACCNHN